jgi:hypothetical protein
VKAKLRLLFLTLFVCAVSAVGQTVVERESTIRLNERTGDIGLVIENRAASGAATVEMAIVRPDDTVAANHSQAIRLKTGKAKYKLTLPLGDLMQKNSDEIAWWRLRYRVNDASGIVSLSEMLTDDFVLRAAAFQRVIPGSPLRIRVRALSPLSQRPVKGVAIKAELTLSIDTTGSENDDDELVLNGTARTNADGFAVVDLAIPENIRLDGDSEIVITGQKNGVVRTIDEEIDDDELSGSVVLTSDKPLYQPGQTFNIRALLLDANNTVVPDAELEFTIEDEDNTVTFRQTVKTSMFGIASVSWPIPENAKLGTYSVEVEADDDLRGDELDFKVSRYDLPNFSVNAKPDKTYYLPSDKEARITVNADYLFGKPVTGGKVRVVQESERKWNYAEQKYESTEGAVSEGEADATGKFVAKFDIADDIEDLMQSDWRRFEDLSFAAYFTDPTTNRTEQRRLDIRLSKEPIHIYFIHYADQHPDLPVTAYVSTFYADGTPVTCNVEVRDSSETLARFKTNSLAAGKFGVRVPRDKVSRNQYEISISARDKDGKTGTFEGSFYIDHDDAIQISTDKSIYKPGEMIEVQLHSSKEQGQIYVDVVKDYAPIKSLATRLRDGRATLRIPYDAAMKGDVMIAAYSDEVEGRWSPSMRAVRAVIFPEQQNLTVDAKFTKASYRPGEDAAVKFSILDGTKRPVESAIGLGIFDKAIEERARTDADFGGGYFSRISRLMGYDRSFGNLTLKDLNDLDPNRPIEPEMQLAAEILLAGNWYFPTIYHSSNQDRIAGTIYAERTAEQIKPVITALDTQFKTDYTFPVDQTSLERILSSNGIELAGLKDPWGVPYFPSFETIRNRHKITLRTSGPDKVRGTDDDFSVGATTFEYFAKIGRALDRVTDEYRLRTGRHIRNIDTLSAELARMGLDLASVKDMWGRSYRIDFDVEGRHHSINVRSLGPNGFFEAQYRGDDFDLWKTLSDYFIDSEREIQRVLNDEVNARKRPFPRTESELREMLARGGVKLDTIKDGYERPVYLKQSTETRYVDRTKIVDGKTTIVPTTEQMIVFSVRTSGADGNIGTVDDRTLATFSAAITEAHRGTNFAKTEVRSVAISGSRGAISGVVFDAAGAVIPGASVVATDEADSNLRYEATSDSDGTFLLANLPSGRYTLHITAPNFKSLIQQNVQVVSKSRVEVTVTLEVGTVSEMVAVTAGGDVDQTVVNTATSVTTSRVTGFKIDIDSINQTSTPKLREYFPETLVWQPELLTDKKGKAELKFKMADNITTWKMFAIASTKKGKVGVVEKEVTAFQPFFVDLDPPKFLTQGDEIHLPTQVRNYTDRRQSVDVTMDRAGWFEFLGASGRQKLDVGPGGTQNAIFGFKAATAIKGGKQRVTAIAQTESDAIEKPVTVRPDGEEIVRTDSRVFDTSTKFDVNFPSNALAGTPKAELKIYPNLFSHVADSVEGLLQRPYGCGEQTISSTYPNLMILKFAKNDPKLREKAGRFLQKGYERLTGYQVADGGFTYWGGKDSSDVALTTYAIRFLHDADEFIEVDERIIERAEAWLVKQQRSDGSWTKKYRWETVEDLGRTKLITSYVARALSMRPASHKDALTRALEYLKRRNAEIDEPYALALYGIASLDSGDPDTAKRIAGQLEKMAIAESSGVYWKLETNTPFYGWGTAGRVETTALVLQLLTRVAKLESRPAGDLASKGLMFLFRNKDRYGVWHSTQTTINVLDTFVTMMTGSDAGQSQSISVDINGTALPPISVDPDRIEPITIDVTDKISVAGANAISVRGSSSSTLMAQTVATHYIDWRDSQSTNLQAGVSRALRLDYKCDRQDVAVMQEVSCSVEAERVGFKGYGMLLAEIGTPPGADVNRESLEAVLLNDWSISRYEVLPDRIVFYMWSRAGGSKFNFKFRPRYGINAQTPASIVYDYYNPEAQAVVTPLRFEAR